MEVPRLQRVAFMRDSEALEWQVDSGTDRTQPTTLQIRVIGFYRYAPSIPKAGWDPFVSTCKG